MGIGAASLGEFEQARPVLEEFRRRHPEYRVLLTFFSPSGYEVRKGYNQADAVRYLPMDTPRNARRLIGTVRPSVAFFVKYEFWYNYLGELHRQGVPTYLISAIFRPTQYFFKPWGRWFRGQLGRCFTHLFVQNEESLHLLESHGIGHCTLAGDTRFDRVHQIAAAAEDDAVTERFLSGSEGSVMVAGSTWPPDEALLAQVRQAGRSRFPDRLILAPHVIDEAHLQQLESLFPDSVRYSALVAPQAGAQAVPEEKRVLVIDNIGLLSRLYRYADVAYVGGGFGVGIHNLLEAVTFGKPVLFGPNHGKFQEALDLLACGGGFSHGDATQLAAHLDRLLADPDAYRRASQACLDYMNAHLGSTETILRTIEK